MTTSWLFKNNFAFLAFCEWKPPVTDGPLSQRGSGTQSFDIFFDIRLNNRLKKQLPSRSKYIYIFNSLVLHVPTTDALMLKQWVISIHSSD